MRKTTAISIFAAIMVSSVVFGQKNGVLCLGNGEMVVYERHSDIIQLFGPPYSSPSVLQLTTTGSGEITSQRETGTGVWTHQLQNGQNRTGKMVDFVVGNIPCFVRTIENTDTLRFRLILSKETTHIDNTPEYRPKGIAHSMLLTSPAGTYAYQSIFYPTNTANYYQLMIKGNASASRIDDRTWNIVCFPGKSDIRIAGGRDYPQCVINARTISDSENVALLDQTRAYWKNFTQRRTDFSKKIPTNVPQRDRLLQAIDDVAVLIKAQQGTEGGVLAGYHYHLGYVRDQYGVSRGLLKLGHIDEAKAILQFYWDIWQRKKILRNAQGIGLDAFHVHENDEVEITGYLIIQAFDYLKATGDNAYVKTIFPMLEWAWDCQVRNLHRNMLPFNGDETYIAGGILPRTVMYDGSAEATMLFLTGGRQLADWAEKQKVRSANKTTEAKKILQTIGKQYPDNFVVDGKLLTNNPARKQGLAYPDFRHGVCESCIKVDWCQKTDNNRYLCAACFPYKTFPDIRDEKHYIRSVSLTPWYIHSNVLPTGLPELLVRDIATSYLIDGKLPSRPEGGRTVGYDYGLFLYALTEMNLPLKDKIYGQMLDVIDDTGAWVEYYENGIPSGTLCRPWESAINIEAAIEYAEKYR